MKKTKDILDRRKCPDETYINRYALHQCSIEERREIEAHLAECSLCRREAVYLTKAQSDIQDEEKWGKLPDRVYKKAMALVKTVTEPKTSHLEICLRFLREQWEIVRHTGLLMPQPVASF